MAGDRDMFRAYAKVSAAAMAKVILIYLAYRGGLYLDDKWGTAPWAMTGLLTLAVAVGIWGLYRVLEAK